MQAAERLVAEGGIGHQATLFPPRLDRSEQTFDAGFCQGPKPAQCASRGPVLHPAKMPRRRHGPYFRAPLKAITGYKLRKLLKYALVAVVVAWVLTLFSGDGVGPLLGAWALLGLWTGVLEEFLF